MHGIASHENPTARELVRHQREPGLPGEPRKKAHVHLGAERLAEHVLRLGIRYPVAVLLAQLGMKDELVDTIDGRHERAPLRVEGPVHPCALAPEKIVQARRLDMDGMHLPAHEVAPRPALAAIGDAELLAHQATRSIGAHQVARCDPPGLPGRQITHLCAHMGAVVPEFLHAGGEMQLHRRQSLCPCLEDALDVHLRAAVRQLGCTPGPRQVAHHRSRIARGRQLEPCQLVPGVAGPVGDVGRVVRRQSLGTDLVGQPEAPKMLHCPCLGRVGGRQYGRVRLVIDQQGTHTPKAELEREHKPGRSAADDDDVGVRYCVHG